MIPISIRVFIDGNLNYVGGIGNGKLYIGTPHIIITLGLISLLIALIKHKKIKFVKLNKGETLIVIFTVLAMFSSLLAPYKAASLTQSNFYITLLIILILWKIVIENLSNLDIRKIFLRSIIFLIFAQTTLVLLQIITNSSLGLSFLGEGTVASRQGVPFPSVTGTFGHPGPLSLFLVISLSILFPYIIQKRNKLYTLGFLIGCMTLILTFSRTNMMLLVLILSLQFLFLITKNKSKISAVKISFLLIASFILLYFLGDYIIERFLNLRVKETDDQVGNRLIHLQIALEYIKEKPLLGYGLNNWAYITNFGGLPELSQIPGAGNPFFYENPVHNVYALFWFEGGIFFVLTFIFITFYYLKNSVSRFTNNDFFSIGLAGGLICIVFYNFTGWGLLNGGQIYSYMYLMFAMCKANKVKINTLEKIKIKT